MKKKKLFKRFSALVCALVVLFGCLGSVTFYKADVLSSVDAINFILEENGIPTISLPSEYKYILVVTAGEYRIIGCDESSYAESTGAIFGCRSGPFFVAFGTKSWFERWLCLTDVDGSGSLGRVLRADYSTYLGWTINELDTSAMYFESGSASYSNIQVLYSDYDIYEACFKGGCESCNSVLSVGSLYYESDLSVIEDVYNSSLGYLKNLHTKTLFLTDKYGNADLESYKRVISFDEFSTTGNNLNSGNYSVRVYGQMAFYKNGSDTLISEDFPLIYFGKFSIVDSSITYMGHELFNFVSESCENPYNAWETVIYQIVRSDNVYYQLYNESTGEYGGYVKVSFYNKDGEEQYIAETVDENLELDEEDGYSDDEIDNDVGGGTTYDDAELDAGEDDGLEFDELTSGLNSLVSTLGAIPRVFASMFSFLPDWCLNLFALAVGFGALLWLWKVGRG